MTDTFRYFVCSDDYTPIGQPWDDLKSAAANAVDRLVTRDETGRLLVVGMNSVTWREDIALHIFLILNPGNEL